MPTYKVNPKNQKEESLLITWLKQVKIKFTKPRKPGGSGKKGKRFEKELSKELSQWMTEGERDDLFYLSSGSGSRFTARQKQGKDTANSCGDIGLLDPIGQPLLDKFSIEAKCGYNDSLDLLSLVDSDNKNHMILDWITKAHKEIEEAGRPYFMIIIQRDRKNKVVVVSNDFFNLLGIWPEKELSIYIKEMLFGFSIVDYDAFFHVFRPGDLCRI